MSYNYYYISSGEKNAMHTLRHAYSETIRTSEGAMQVDRDHYCVNLSTDWEKAVEKAKAFAGDALSISKSFTLNDIKRRTEEELAEARRQEEIAQAEWEEKVNQRRSAQIDLISEGIWPFGKFGGEKIAEAPNSYIRFMGEMELDDTPENTVMAFLKKYLHDVFPEIFNLPTPNGEYFGEPKLRTQFVATVVAKFSFDSEWGTTTVLKMVKDSGELVVYMGGSCPHEIVYNECGQDYAFPEVGNTYAFKATVKGHEEFRDEKQTKVQRIVKWEKV